MGSKKKAAQSSQPQGKPSSVAKISMHYCAHCRKNLKSEELALFVEEEVGRIFCSERCITHYFSDDIEMLERKYSKRVDRKSDLSVQERESFAHLRWITLQEPNEIWRQKTKAGDFRYTLISEFRPGKKKIWCICICLILRGQPSFLYMAIPTRTHSLVEQYRRGKKVNRSTFVQPAIGSHEDLPPQFSEKPSKTNEHEKKIEGSQTTDSFFDETLGHPDEVWSSDADDRSHLKLYHFIKYFDENLQGEDEALWYVIIARQTSLEEEVEVLEAFPTHDEGFVDRYRRGHQELGISNQTSARLMQMVH